MVVQGGWDPALPGRYNQLHLAIHSKVLGRKIQIDRAKTF